MALEQARHDGEQRIDPLASLETADEQQPLLRRRGSDRAGRETERDCPVAATEGIDAHRFTDGADDGAGRGGDAVSVPDAPALETARQTEVHRPRPSLGRRDDRQRRDDAKDHRDEPGALQGDPFAFPVGGLDDVQRGSGPRELDHPVGHRDAPAHDAIGHRQQGVEG